MVSRRFLSLASLSLALAALTAHAVSAEEWRGHHRHDRDRTSGFVDSGLPSIIPGIGTYSGAISALKVRGNGIYFSMHGIGTGRAQTIRPKARIIDASSAGNPCAYEAGVCVIRP